MSIVGKAIYITTDDLPCVLERLQVAGVKYEIVDRGPMTEVRYDESAQLDHLVAPYILPSGMDTQ